jgi:hypothetical protein
MGDLNILHRAVSYGRIAGVALKQEVVSSAICVVGGPQGRKRAFPAIFYCRRHGVQASNRNGCGSLAICQSPDKNAYRF